MDLRRSTVDLDFICFSSMAGRDRPPTNTKLEKSRSALSFSSNDHYRFSQGPVSPGKQSVMAIAVGVEIDASQ